MEAIEALYQARAMEKTDRKGRWERLNTAFRSGWCPAPHPDGRFAGRFEAFDFGPGLTRLAEIISAVWMPWKGKWIYAPSATGLNILARSSLPLVRVLWPFYRYYLPDKTSTYRAFPFRLYFGPGSQDPDKRLLHIDYDLPLNPWLNVRRVHDELVQVGRTTYLGKSYLRLWSGTWKLWSFFVLEEA